MLGRPAGGVRDLATRDRVALQAGVAVEGREAGDLQEGPGERDEQVAEEPEGHERPARGAHRGLGAEGQPEGETPEGEQRRTDDDHDGARDPAGRRRVRSGRGAEGVDDGDGRRGDRDGAIQALRDYAAKNRDGALAPYAQFWVGEAQLASGRYYEAILAYNEVATNWPRSDRVPAAKLRQAEAFAASGDPMDARLYLKELIDKYPGTSEAAEAERRLRSLGG